jgi:hypothetical protein
MPSNPEQPSQQLNRPLIEEQSELRIICESLETKARGFELQAKEHVPTGSQKMATSAESQLKWAAAYHRAAAIIRNRIASGSSK